MDRLKQSLRRWYEERFGRDLFTWLTKKRVPRHKHTIWYYLGGMTLFLFTIQVVTGILLLLYYRPAPEAAFQSVQYVMTRVQFGWLVRGVHAWSANLLILAALMHMFSAYLTKAYRRPRELTWVTGCLLIFLLMAFGFTGYLLPWNARAFFATKVGTEMVAVVPLMGKWLLHFLRGGDEVTGATLTRLFGFHVAILPALATLLLGTHLFLVQYFGMSVPPGVQLAAAGKPLRSYAFMPNFLLRDIIGWYLALAALAALAALFPWELGVKADAFAPTPAGIRPEWYFLFLFQTLKATPRQVLGIEGEQFAVLLTGLIALLWVCVPFLDKDPQRRSTRVFTAFGVVAILYIAAMSLWAWRS